MTVRGIEAINLYIPPTKTKLDNNIKEELGQVEEKKQLSNISSKSLMTSVDRYRQEWSELLKYLDEHPDNIHLLAFGDGLKNSKFRCIIWSLLLRVLNADHRTWVDQRNLQRSRYDKLKEEFAKNPHNFDVVDDDPLSQSPMSVWNQYFNDKELYNIIKQDVVRTFPSVEFFRKTIIQTSMCNILFYYAREHPYMSYRQGMHEILAPIIFVMFSDHQALLHFIEIAKTDIDETLQIVLNTDFLEADSYSIFSRVMSSIESYYRIANVQSFNSSNNQSVINENPISSMTSEVEVIGQLNFIRDNILAKEDLHLHNHLTKLDIPLHIFGIRWLRLLFGREFALLDLLVLWDAIFADSDRFELPNFILVAMLIHIRDKLLLSDYTTCLTYLMRYPSNADINIILRHALHMQMPTKYDRPANAFVYFTMNPTERHKSPQIATMKPTTKANISNLLTRKSSNHNMPKTNITAVDDHECKRDYAVTQAKKLQEQIIFLQQQNATNSSTISMNIAEGYLDNGPDLLRLELRNAQSVIKIARSKLQAYSTVVRQETSTNNSNELAQALNGIEELCEFLNVKFIFPMHSGHSTHIDQALEANEQQNRLKQMSIASAKQVLVEMANNEGIGSDTITEINEIPGVASTEVNSGITYEKPDNGFMLKSSHYLSNRKEIELMPIANEDRVVKSINEPCKRMLISNPLSHPLAESDSSND